jgi:hypothetical protein
VSTPTSGGGTPLKIRLERLKHASNLRLDFLKRLYDRRPIAELYASGEHCLHIHFRSVGSFCATYRAGHIREIGDMGLIDNVKRQFVFGLGRDKVDVLVGVGKVLKDGRPLTSTVRLQRLDCCHMRGIEAIQPSSPYPPFEALLAAFDRELSSFDNAPGIEAGEFKDEVIEGRSQIVDCRLSPQ